MGEEVAEPRCLRQKYQWWGGQGKSRQTQGNPPSSDKRALTVPMTSENTHRLPHGVMFWNTALLAALWKLSLESSPGQKRIE